MLVIFTFGITPKNYWHECLANHNQLETKSADTKTTFSKTGFDCHCDEMVVSTSFTNTSSDIHLVSFTAYKEFPSSPYHFIFYHSYSAKDLRGPPATA